MAPFQLSNNQRTFEAILDGLSDAVLVIDFRRRIVFANRALIQLFNLRQDPVGRDVMEVVLDHRITAVIERALEIGTSVREELTLTIPNNESSMERKIEVDAEALTPELESEPYVSVVLKDQTARHEIEQVRRDFVANASHELRTPLSIINGYIENLLDGAADDPQLARRFLRIMKKHGERIARIVEDMLTISKLESAVEDPSKAGAFDLRGCVADVIERLQPLIEAKKAIVKIAADEDTCLMAGDRFYWDQIFFNLIENSLKQNFRPGLHVTISLARQDDMYRIVVADDGVGIPQSDLPYIFKRFYRVEKHHSQEIKGTGLGLSIVKRAVEAHQGKISARSIPGEITAFEIIVPRGAVDEVEMASS